MFRHLRRPVFLAVVVAFAFASAPRLQATDGHFLHGIGAINSAMGGAGVGAPSDLLGTIYLNPAGLIVFEQPRVDLGFEMFKADRSVASTFGPYSGTTPSKSAFVPIPAFAWSTRLKDGKIAVGVGGLGIGGFGVDYPVSMTNPILAPRPNGFGQVFSNYQLMKIAPLIAFAVNDRLTIGVAGNMDWATLAVDPFPAASPAVDPGPDGVPYTADDRAYYPSTTATDGVFGFGVQVGMLYKASHTVTVGAAYTSQQFFKPFQWQSVSENPNLPSYQMPLSIEFKLNIPAVYAVGIGLTPTDRLTLAGDFRYITYDRTAGFKDSGYDATGAVKGFGWKNVKVLAVGTEYRLTPTVALRGGYNYSDNPVPDAYSMYNLPAPGIVQHHLTMGVGFEPLPHVGVNLAYYHAFENSGTGPMVFPSGGVPGTSVTNRMKEDSILVQFSFSR